jgi:GrpB-like predicted nucleotidyltransferase (UPF0157 family)
VSNAPPPITIVDYDASWPQRFAAEREAMAAALGEAMVGVAGIEHIGSTSVTGCAAKPIIDIMVGVAELEKAAGVTAALEQIGYVESRSRSPATRLSFEKGRPDTHHAHVVEFEGDEWRQMTGFRDFLRANASAARRYGSLKRELARTCGAAPFAYSGGKAPFIEAVLAELGPHRR